MMRAVLGLSLLAMAGLAALFLNPATPASAATVAVKVGDFYFCDLSFQNGVCDTKIDVNDTVRWEFTNSGPLIFHTTTECGASCGAPTATPLWNSGLVGPGPGAPFEYTFTQAGTYLYYCSFHPFSMRGRIIVNGPVGGIAEIDAPDVAPLDAAEASGTNYAIIGIAAGTALAVAAAGGVAWYARRRI